jgi:hypothetical protein
MPEIMKPLFPLGRTVATHAAASLLESQGEHAFDYLRRHASGDWGDLCEEDKQSNQEALECGDRILSAYRLEDGTKIWIITEADRSSTCCLLPSEY